MPNELFGLIALIICLTLMFLGVPIAFTFMIAGAWGIWMIRGAEATLSVLGLAPFTETSKFVLVAVPMFVLMGLFIAQSGIARELYETCYKWVGSISGGLAISTVMASAAFAACSGSSLASAMTMSTIAIPEMRRFGYKDHLMVGCVTISGTLAILIPPSLLFILYGYLTDVCVAKLFIAGIVPGILLTIIYVVLIVGMCKINPTLGPRGQSFTWKEKLTSLKSTLPIIILFIAVIGGLYVGIYTPTEAGAAGAFLSLIIALARRKMTPKIFFLCIKETVELICMIFTIIIGAMIFGYLMALSDLPSGISTIVIGLNLAPFAVMSVIFLIYLFLGMFMESFPMLVLTLPIFFPIIVNAGFDPVHFGVLVCIITELALVTPPVGMAAYAVSAKSGIPLVQVFRGIIPFAIVLIGFLFLLGFFPQLSLFLPNMMRR